MTVRLIALDMHVTPSEVRPPAPRVRRTGRRPRRAPRARAPRSLPPPTPAPPRARRPGRLSVNTSPWAHVVVDGQRIGITPLYGRSLSAGVHVLELVSPGGLRLRRRILLREGQHLNMGMLRLK